MRNNNDFKAGMWFGCALICAMVLITAISGCASGTYQRAGATTQDFEKERYECKSVAVAYSHQVGDSGNPLIIGDHWAQCMSSRGWQYTATPSTQ